MGSVLFMKHTGFAVLEKMDCSFAFEALMVATSDSRTIHVNLVCLRRETGVELACCPALIRLLLLYFFPHRYPNSYYQSV